MVAQIDYWSEMSHTLVDKVIDHDYQLLEELGHGSYGCLFLGQSLRDKTYVAVKALSKIGLDHQQRQLQQLEVDIQASLKHPSLLGLDRVIHEKDHIFLVMELCDQGDLFDYVVREPLDDEALIKSTFLQILDAVAHMHKQGVYHRDLKLENVLLKSVNEDDSDDFVCKVADFGLATRERYSLEFGCGSTTYLAPEHFEEDTADDQVLPYDAAASDVWSLGILLLALMFGRNPWQEATNTDVAYREYQRKPAMLKKLFPQLSRPCARLLQSVLAVHSTDRPTVEEFKNMFGQLDHLLDCPTPLPAARSSCSSFEDEALALSMHLPMEIPSKLQASFDSAIFSSGMSWSDMVEEDFQRCSLSSRPSSIASSIVEEPEDEDDSVMFVHGQEKDSWWL
ncbi:kinase-like protein [Hesseltinella vesiculosa]|uniref:Kinase-like protein n=1 Tax=Hesseltinella vesiculosa TaxID=101127 RepID=A0A1X2G4N6_9FUNG|nr:kinase-like protein [Hesseltinella vesiculosa]